MTEPDFLELQGYMQAIAASTKAALELAGCTGKSAFDRASQAQMARRPHTPGTVQPYRCRHCRKWHLGAKS